MIQLKVYKTKGDSDTALFLDLYETEPIKLTLSIEDITQADATSVFSKTFRVPATRHNNEFFENAYEVDGIFFDVTLKNYAEILVDGAEFREGHIRLQKIFRNQDLDRIDYELLFLGETRDFSSTIAEKTLCQLTMTDFNWEGLPQNYTNAADFTGPFQYNDIVTSWLAFPQTANLTTGYADGDIIMPLIDHGNTYDDGDPEQGTIALGATGNGIRSFTHSANSLALTRMKPMFRAKRVWDQIFEDAGYTYSSTFLNSDKFHQMYISAFGNDESIGMEIDQVTGTNFESNNPTSGENDVNAFMYNDNVITNIAGNYTVGSSNVSASGNGSYFTCPGDATLGGNFYIMSASAELAAYVEQSNGPNVSVPAFIRLVVVQTPGGTITQTLATGQNAGNGSTSSITWDSRNGGYQPVAGDIIQVYLDTSSGFVDYSYADNTYWDCTAAPGDYYAPLDLDCEHKQIDYIKDILTMFRLVMQPDNKRPNNFIIEPWQEFIGSGRTYDWSHKLVEDMDSVLEPLFNTQSATIEYSKAEDEDFINKFHQDNNKHAYGYLQFNSTNELLKGTRKIDIKGIAPTPIDQIVHGSAGVHPEPSFILPSIVEVTGDSTTSNPARAEQLPIKPKTRFLFYNGKEPITVSQNEWYLNNDSGNGVLQTNYPLVSPYENWPVQQSSLNLNFSNDTRYYINPSPGTGYFEQGSTLFDEYWSRYISSLYNKYSRRLTAKFILNNVDLQDLTFDDVIFVNGKYYRPEKIIDAQVGAETVVTCQLITLGDQRPIWLEEPLTGFSVVASNTSCLGQEGEIQITTNGTPAFTWELDASGAQGNNNPTGSAPFTFTIPAPVGVDTLTVTDSLGRVAVVQVNVPASTASQVTSTNSVVQPTICSDTPVVETTIVDYESTVAQPVSTNANYAIFNTKVVDLLESQVARPLTIATQTGFNAFGLGHTFVLNTTTHPNLTTEWSGTITWTNLSFITTNWSQYELGYSGPDGLTPSVIPSQYISGWPTNLPPVGTSFTVTVTGLPVQYGAAGISPSPTMDFLVLKNSITNSDWNGKWENTGSIIGKQLTVATTCNGEIDVTPAGGAGAPYTVIWSDAYAGEDRTGLCPGNYQYYVEDVNGCQSDIYDVTLTCQTTLYYYQLREHLNNCTQSSSAIYIASSTSQLPINQTVTLNERAGCYYVQAVSTDTPLYTIDALSVSCAACNGGGTPLSYEVEECGGAGDTYYASRTGATLVPGNVVELSLPGAAGCYVVIGDSTSTADSDVTAIYADCATCLSTPPVYYYGFLSCDGTFDGPIESPVQLTTGSFIDITPGPGCGSVYKETNGPAIYTWSGTLLYEDCDACNGVTPPPAQNCHLIQNGGLTVAQGTYTFNGLGYGWTVKPGTTISICAVVGSVTITSGTATITNQGNACTQPSQCLIGPPPASVYTVEDCETGLNWTMDDMGSQFQLGEIIQYYQNLGATGARYCGEVINYTGTPNASLANAFVAYVCGDAIHCAQ